VKPADSKIYEALASQEIDQGRVKVFDINTPPVLHDWEQFLKAYSSRQGTLIRFRKQKDSSVWKIDNSEEKESWTVQEWGKWFKEAKNKKTKDEAFYLVDVPLLPPHIKKLRDMNPLVDAFAYKGKYCFSGYVK
jgi:hypothetical protein